MKKIILGIDPGIADTGFGLIEVNGADLKFLECGVIKTDAKLKLADRLVILYKDLNSLIKKYQPDLVAIEELYFNKNVKTALIVGQARGIVLLSVKMKNIPLLGLTPSQVKQAVCAYGKAPKKQVQEMVKKILKLKNIPQPDDAADALATAIGAAGLNYVK
jgi:crossover junction endodeoxyribonuclease RuvC